jgi:hydrogenase-4 component B
MVGSALFLTSIPVLLVGAALAAGLRTNRARGIAALVTQAIAMLLVLVGLWPIVLGEVAIEVTWPWPAPIEQIAFRLDGLGAFFLAWSLPMTFLGTLYAVGYLRPYFHAGRNGGSHFALLNLTALSLVLIYSVQNALVFLLGWEIAAVAAWLLVIWDYRSQKIRFAGFNYLVSTHVDLFVLVAAFMLLHSHTGSMDFADFGNYLASNPSGRGTVFLLLGVSFALKSGFFPFHTWLPRAHAAAPAHVSALLSGVVSTSAGLFGFLRFTLLAGKPEAWMGWSVLLFGAASAIFGALYTATQRDLKRMLGYSSTENVGIAAMAFGAGMLGWAWGNPTLATLGFGGGLLHILNHALFKCGLFYAAGAIARATHTMDLERLGGLARRMPRVTVVFLIGGLAMCALPPFNGFASEFLIYAGLFSGAAPTPEGDVVLVCAAAILAFVGAVAALSFTRAFGLTFLGVSRDPTVHVHGDEAPRSMVVPMVVHACGIVILGVYPDLAVRLAEPALALFPFETVEIASVLSPVVWACRVLSVVLAIAMIAMWRRRAVARESVTWGCGYTAGTPRMQYTGSSFSAQLSTLFRPAVPVVTREHLPTEPFPQHASHLSTNHPDAVERRMFEVLGQGEKFVHDTSARIPEQPRFAFAAGLLALVVVALVALGEVM